MIELNLKADILQPNTDISAFESGDAELDDFLFNDAKNYRNSLLAVTYLVRVENEIAAYFCLSNDRLIKDSSGNSEWNKLNRSIANDKRRKNYPAVKIGRLAVSKKYSSKGLGSSILRIVREMYANHQQQAGCRFITIDEYQNALGFYQKNGFAFLTEKDCKEETRAMYLDLMAFV